MKLLGWNLVAEYFAPLTSGLPTHCPVARPAPGSKVVHFNCRAVVCVVTGQAE